MDHKSRLCGNNELEPVTWLRIIPVAVRRRVKTVCLLNTGFGVLPELVVLAALRSNAGH